MNNIPAKKLRFSIITVVFNGEKVIEKTIQSVLNQKFLPYEYIIIDGCSTDNTIKIVQESETLFDQKGVKYKIISEQDTGIYNAMNKGIKIAEGDFISFLNAGDWYQLDALKNINTEYLAESFDLIYGGLNYIIPNGKIKKKMSSYRKFPVSSRHWNHPSMFLRRELYQNIYFDESLLIYSDFDLYLKLRKKRVKITIVDKIITNFVADGISTSLKLSNVLLRAQEKYQAYRQNGYGRIYWFESYGWELFKWSYFLLHK